MSKKMTRLTTTLVACAFLFALTSGAEAGALDARAPRVEAPVSLVDMAGDWFANLWTGMTQIFEKDAQPSQSRPDHQRLHQPERLRQCGWVIDPNG